MPMRLLALILLSPMAYAGQFTATWDHPNPDNVTHYNTQYQTDHPSFEVKTEDGFGYLGPTEEMSKVFDVDAGTFLTFRVSACNNFGCSDWLVGTISEPELPTGVILIRGAQ